MSFGIHYGSMVLAENPVLSIHVAAYKMSLTLIRYSGYRTPSSGLRGYQAAHTAHAHVQMKHSNTYIRMNKSFKKYWGMTCRDTCSLLYNKEKYKKQMLPRVNIYEIRVMVCMARGLAPRQNGLTAGMVLSVSLASIPNIIK